MTRLVIAVLLLLAACDKPTPENCRKALLNMQHLLGTENLTAGGGGGLEGEIRRCRGGSSKESVDCAIKASTLDELRTCDFNKLSEMHPSGGSAGSGSQAGSATK